FFEYLLCNAVEQSAVFYHQGYDTILCCLPILDVMGWNHIQIIDLWCFFFLFHAYFFTLFLPQREDFNSVRMIRASTTMLPMTPRLKPFRRLEGSIVNTARIASAIPTRPSPAIIPAQYRVPSLSC